MANCIFFVINISEGPLGRGFCGSDSPRHIGTIPTTKYSPFYPSTLPYTNQGTNLYSIVVRFGK